MINDELKKAVVQDAKDTYNKPIKPVPAPEHEIGIDLSNALLHNIADSAEMEASTFDANVLNSFTQVAQSRDQLYQVLDDMSNDTTLSAVLETYAEDATETNDRGNIVWCESEDPEVAGFVTYLLNALNVDKNAYTWVHHLCKYGDLYLRLYRESDYEDLLFDRKKDDDKRRSLNEDIKLRYYGKNDNYVHYLEMAPNPAEVFELTRFGKTAAYIVADVQSIANSWVNTSQTSVSLNKYNFYKKDVNLFPPTEWVHASLEDNSSRIPEEVDLFISDDKKLTYKVKRGQSLLYNSYKVWRQLMLLENSVLLQRVSGSSIVRVIGVEVGDMPKENVQPHLMSIKQLIEQRAALDVGNSMSEYTNPGPVVNNVYIPTRNQQGVLTSTQIGGDVNIGELTDLDYYTNKLFGGLRVPKQFFSQVDDSAGFSGGQSLSIISSRYAKMVKRIQNTFIQALTDAINLILIDTHNDNYINKFTLRMQAPTTQEEIDRRDNIVNKVGMVRDIMDTLGDIETPSTKLKITKSLLSNVVNDNDVIQLLQEEIDALVAAENPEETPMDAESPELSAENTSGYGDYASGETDYGFSDSEPLNLDNNDTMSMPDYELSDDEDLSLPSPGDLDIGDVSDATNPELG